MRIIIILLATWSYIQLLSYFYCFLQWLAISMSNNDALAKAKLEKILTDHDRITCPLCCQLFKEPRYLYCDHVYCEQCLEKIQDNSIIICPGCNRETSIAKEGVQGLPKNFFLAFMADNVSKHAAKSLTYTSRPETAIMQCMEHEVGLSFYCETYDQLVCKHCAVGKHGGHQYDSCIVKKYQQKLEEIAKSLELVIKNLSEDHDDIEIIEKEIKQKCDQAMCKKIDQNYQEIVDSLMKEKGQPKQQIPEVTLQIESNFTAEPDITKRNLEIRRAEVSEVKQMCDVLLEDANDQEILEMQSLIDSISQLVCVYQELNVQLVRPAVSPVSWPNLGHLCSTADPSKCEVLDLPGFVFKDHRTSFTVITKDDCGEYCCSKVRIWLEGVNKPYMEDVEIIDNSDGSYTATIIPQQVGVAKLSILVSEKHIKGSPHSLTIRESYASIRKPDKTLNIGDDKSEPWSIACNEAGYTWGVTDKRNGSIYVYNGKNNKLRKLQRVPEAVPLGITFDGNNMYVVDSAKHQVLKFDEHDKCCLQFGQKIISNAYDIVVHGGRVYVTNRGKKYRCILVFTTGGIFRFSIGSDYLNTPQGMAVDVNYQLIFVADSYQGCVFTFTLDGLFVRKFGGRGASVGQLNKPEGVASDSNGTVFVTDSKTKCVSIFNKEGIFIHSFGHGQFKSPCGIALDPTGIIYVCDSENGCIIAFINY